MRAAAASLVKQWITPRSLPAAAASNRLRHLAVRLPVVHHDGQPGLHGQRRKALEHVSLDLAGRVFVVKVEAGLTDGDDLGMAGEAAQPVHGLRAHVLGVVRVHAHGGVEAGVFFRQAHRRVVGGKIPRSTDDDQGVDAGLLCAGEHVVAVRIELLGLDVAMGVDEAWEAGSHRTPPSPPLLDSRLRGNDVIWVASPIS